MGLKHAGDPQWFYRLTHEDQIAVLAVNRPEKKRRRMVGPLAKQVKAANPEAESFWLGG